MLLTHSHKLTISMNTKVLVRDHTIKKEKEKKKKKGKKKSETFDLHFSPKALCLYMLKTV